MADVLFKTYAGQLPAASTPPARTDKLLLVQGTSVAQLQIKDLISNIPIFSDATAGPVTVDIATYTDVMVIKTDSGASAVTIIDTTGKTILRGTSADLEEQDAFLHLILNGTNWHEVS